MLSRHAESLFWTGRYVERAGDTARMLDVTYHSLLESPHLEARRTWTELLDVLGLTAGFRAAHDHVSADAVNRFLVLGAGGGSAIVPAIGLARENARSVRELLSTELWESINTFWLELQGRDLEADLEHQPYALYRLVKRHSQEFAGTAAETMPHEDGWRFLLLGGMLERAMLTARLVAVRLAPFTSGAEDLDFYKAVDVLKSAAGLEAFRRTHPGNMTAENVLAFLLLSPTFPRSVLFAVRSAGEKLDELSRPGQLSRPQRVLGRIQAELDFSDVHDLLRGDLPDYLQRVQTELRGLAELLGVQFFRNAEELSVLHSVATS
jgi:uncharacterized alpha-E superfamily protein